MLPRSQSDNFANGRPKKKPAPPRPPQPSHLKLQNSTSFRSGTENKSYQRSMSISAPVSRPGNDLIDFSTPPSSPPTSANYLANISNKPSNEFMYRVGASVFYIKSPLKNSTSGKPSAPHPFSPPRPSPQSLLSTPIKSAQPAQEGPTPLNNPVKPTPTIIRSYGGSSVTGNASNYSAGSNNNNTSNTNVWNSSTPTESKQYGNIPLVWDEPPKKTPPVIAPKPTIIRPSPATSITSSTTTTAKPSITPQATTANASAPTTRNYYDVPPDVDEDDAGNDDYDAGDSFASPPMPDEPPPPPPPDLELDAWGEVNAAETATDYNDYEQYTDPYAATNEGDRAYAIVLYDFTPEQDGDLALQAGDLVYLSKKIDDSWLYGVCGGVEGMFPSGYVNIQVPLADEEDVQVPEPAQEDIQTTTSTEDDVQVPEINSTEADPNNQKFYYANVLYQFQAETDNDLSIEPGEVVTIWGRINDDWLYGTINRKFGQFPASFVDTVPADLPTIEV